MIDGTTFTALAATPSLGAGTAKTTSSAGSVSCNLKKHKPWLPQYQALLLQRRLQRLTVRRDKLGQVNIIDLLRRSCGQGHHCQALQDVDNKD